MTNYISEYVTSAPFFIRHKKPFFLTNKNFNTRLLKTTTSYLSVYIDLLVLDRNLSLNIA